MKKEKRRFVVSDIHGCLATFRALLENIDLNKKDELYLLGDYVDRGPDSKGVIDLIFDLQEHGQAVYCLRGNHEQMLLDAWQEEQKLDFWVNNGGRETLKSFACDHPKDIPAKYLDFFRGLDYYFEIDDYILVHAGLNFRHAHPFADQEAMLWIRNWHLSISPTWLGGRKIVHGHTPRQKMIINNFLTKLDEQLVIDIDNGCVFQRPGLGHLCAFEMTSQKLWFEKNVES